MKNKIIDTLNIVEGKPILNLVVLAISLFISLCMATVIVSTVRFVIAVPIAILSSELAPNHILVHSESNALYLMDTKTKKETSLALNADLIATNSEYNKFYLINVLESKIEIKEIKKFKDIIVNSSEFEIKTTLNKSNDLEVKVGNNLLFLFDKSTNEMIQLNLLTQLEDKRLEVPLDLVNWGVSDDKVYIATNEAVYNYNAQNELETLLNWEGLKGISVNNGILTIIDCDETLGFLTSFELETLEFFDAIAFETEGAELLEASPADSYIYLCNLNSQGGISVEALNLSNGNTYFINLNLNDVKSNLKFYKRFGYYINQSDQSVVFTDKDKLIEFELDEPIKDIYPFY